MMITTRVKAAIAGAAAGLALLAVTAGPTFAQAPTPQAGAPPTHAQMEQMMDAMHGAGTSQRMHEAMGPDAEKLMDQCVSMMGMMQNMQGMMGQGMSGMMGGENGQSMQDMMRNMMQPSAEPGR